ncbi:MAG TPA: acyltransferase [Puia sp.]|nr:acyltransferase [Puia sp.]
MQKNLPFLQVCRGLAALVVVFHHIHRSELFYFGFAPFGGIFEVGFNSVDFFFALSGFIIFYVHFRDLGQAAMFRKYCTKRLVRIYPLYWIVSLLAVVLIMGGGSQVLRPEVRDALVHPSAWLRSFLLLPQREYPFLGVAWSLSYEMFFYVIFGLAILLDKRMLILLPLLYVGANILKMAYPPAGQQFAISFLSAHYQMEFMLGMLAARIFLYSLQPGSRAEGWKPVLRWLWLPGLVLFLFTWYASISMPLIFSRFDLHTKLCYGLGAASIILSCAQFSEIGSTWYDRLLLLVGDASFSLYLLHSLVLSAAAKTVVRLGLFHSGSTTFAYYGYFLLMALICVVTGILLHKWVEKPLLSALRQGGKKAPAAARS